MTEKISFLPTAPDINPVALCHHIAEREGIEALVAVVKIGGAWHTCWAGVAGSLAGELPAAALILLDDVQDVVRRNR